MNENMKEDLSRSQFDTFNSITEDNNIQTIEDNIGKYRAEIERLKALKRNMEIQRRQMGQAPLVNQSTGRGQSQGKQMTLNTGHNPDHSSIPVIPNDTGHTNGGFATNLIIALILGFASGAIATAVYIFMNLSKVVVSL